MLVEKTITFVYYTESFYATANNIYDFDMTIFNRWGQKISIQLH